MPIIFLIHTKVDHKHGICLLVATLLFHGDMLSKLYLPPPQIIQRLSQFMKQVMNAFG